MNPVALITGGSRGIGRGIGLELARIGYDLVINFARQLPAARQTADDCVAGARSQGQRIRAEICQADVASKADRQKLIAFARQTFGRLDLLVNNAGVAPEVRADILATTEESFDRLININLKGAFFLTQLAAQWMIEQTQAGRAPKAGPNLASRPAADSLRPKIVTISSISASTVSVNRAEYCIAKAALAMSTALFAVRLAEYGIRVFEIRPGIMATDMTQGMKDKYDQLIQQGLLPIARWGTPADVGKAVAAIAQDGFPYSTGEVIHVDGGFHVRRL